MYFLSNFKIILRDQIIFQNSPSVIYLSKNSKTVLTIYTLDPLRFKIEPPPSLSTSAFPSTGVFHSISERFLLRQTSRRHVLDIEVKHQIP